MTVIEIAEEWKMNPRAVESLLRRALKKFNERLKEKHGEDITIYDILPALYGRGDYDESMSSL